MSSIHFEHRQLQAPGWQDFHVATFATHGVPAASYEDEEPPAVPPGLRPERACLFTRNDVDLRCSYTYSNAPGNQYLKLTKQFFTDVRRRRAWEGGRLGFAGRPPFLGANVARTLCSL